MRTYHSSQSQRNTTSVPRASVGTGYKMSTDDRTYDTRIPNSARRYKPQHAVVKPTPRTVIKYEGVYTPDELPFVRRRTTAPQPQKPSRSAPRQFHWLTTIGVSLVLMASGALVLPPLFQWWQISQDDSKYGRPRTTQIDAVVGHNDSAKKPSHFIAINYNRQVQVIEFPGGNPSKAKIYVGPLLLGEKQELVPVTLTFADRTQDNKPDMIIHVGGSEVVFVNDNNQFRPVKPGEQLSKREEAH